MSSRREFLSLLGASAAGATALTLWPGVTRAATGADSRFLVLMLRGGLDGVHAVPPWGDPAYARARGPMALTPAAPAADGAPAALKLDGTFALHPALAGAAELYARGEFMPLIAAAPPYWGRSHFDAQDCVENGTAVPHGAQTGWLNRAVAALPGADGLAVATVMPLMLRGPAAVASWSPPLPLQVNPILLQRLEPLYGEDPRLTAAFAQAIANQGADQAIDRDMRGGGMRGGGMAAPAQGRLPGLMKAAGTFMAQEHGPRIGFVEDYGWDTHANEAPILARKLKELDDAFAAFRAAAAPVWPRTVLIAVTEFGRTAAINGTNGTDHGTGAAMFLAGGALRGGRVGGQWPGMGPGELYQGRDIHATTDIRAVFKGVLAAHLGLTESALASRVFPGSATLAPAEGLLRAA
ncbi:MAG TPA: DUF1501 domain-containing protein [Steroidobacteraceae bacterium]|nr:DUF1501 domain-containing protein [Steroidobacteraceae bacterium]